MARRNGIIDDIAGNWLIGEFITFTDFRNRARQN